MTPQRWQRIEELFHSALECEANERAPFLDKACGSDAELRRQVERLLASLEEAGDFIEEAPLAGAIASIADESADQESQKHAGTASLIGRRISHYEIRSFLGAGGMGEVYLAHDLKLDRQIALKILPDRFTEDDAQVERFEREARAASALNHPNIITIYEIGGDEGTHFIATEFVTGQTLREKIRSGRMSVKKILSIAIQIADALAVAHAAGIVHRDIKPENVMVRPDALVKVVDFGLARPAPAGLETAPGAAPTPAAVTMQTDPRMLMGTIAYLSPEQVLGQEVDHRADLFSLGAVLYELATGTRPFTGDSAAMIVDAILGSEPAHVTSRRPDLPLDLERIIDRALAKDREARYQTADRLCADLKRLEQALNVAPAPGRMMMKTAPILAAIAVLLLTLAVWRWRESATKDAPSPWVNARSIRLTAYPGEEFSPRLFPDGQSFVFARQVGDDWDICWQRMGETSFKNLTRDCAADDIQPAISPDGARIAFRSECGGGIFIMDSNGKRIRQLTDAGYNPVWSPDGKEILYSTGKVFNPHIRRIAGSQLWATNVATGERRRLPTQDALHPSWSPHGMRVAYWGVNPNRQLQRDIWTIPAQGGEPVAVTDDTAFDWNPVWSPDGQYVYFVSDRNGVMSLWRVPIEEQSGKVLGPPEAVTGPAAESWHPSLSPDGRRLVYVQRIARENLRLIGFDPERETVVGTPVSITQDMREAGAASFSPDGQWLAFHNFGNPQEDIFVVKRDGSEVRQLTNDTCRDRFPNWSPDGRQIAFHSDCGGAFNIWTVNPASGERQQITNRSGPGCSFPVWSPDGTQLAYHCRGLNTFILEISQPGFPQAKFALPPMKEVNRWLVVRSWSPDGRKLAGMRVDVDDEVPGIFVYSLTSQQYEQITQIGDHPVWLSDSRRLLFTDQRKLYLADSLLKIVHEILSLDQLRISSAALSSDDRRIYFTAVTAEADIRLLTRE